MGTGISSLNDVKSIAVIGAGQMGAGIAQVMGAAGYSTQLHDQSAEAVERAMQGIAKRLARAVEKEAITQSDADAALGKIKAASALEDLASADIVVEAIIENEAIKLKLLGKLDEICKPETLFATNTSSISITKLAAGTKRPDQVVGMHFMNPVPVMKLIELIRGLQTSDATYEVIRDLTLKLDKTPVTAKFDYPGFVVNRILIPMLNEACFVLQEGIATPEDIDAAMMLGTNHPMGPLTLADFVGLDTCLYIAQIFHREFGDSKYRPCPLLVKYVEAGWLGKKAGRGFYRYDQ